MRNCAKEFENRVAFIRELVSKSGMKGIIYGNSGGKASALVGILCKAACDNTVGIIMPCTSKRNYGMDTADAMTVAERYGIETRRVDLSPVKEAAVGQISEAAELNTAALSNIAPRLRMMTLYAVAAAEQRLVAGTGNRSGGDVGYFTKGGDGAHDCNPISDLTGKEIFEVLRYLKAPECIIEKAPSAGLFDGQTDESEMGLSYAKLDEYLLTGKTDPDSEKLIEKMHSRSLHKLEGIKTYA